ncbi:MAG: CotH kinase family protein [Bacteroidales bacterium]|nr:CotH kinase family protein [Bacteroidales bacterium]
MKIITFRSILPLLISFLILSIALPACQPDIIIEEEPDIPVKGISLRPLELTLEPGQTSQLQLTVLPDNATDPTVRWTTDNRAVATVQEGLVTALASGKAQITAISNDGGFRAVCFLTVPGDEPAPEPEPQPSDRWADTGADVPAWPGYNKVGRIEDFPAIYITSDDGQRVTSKTSYKGGTIRFCDPAKMYSDVTEVPAGKMQIRGRGNTTWDDYKWTKPSYRIKLDVHSKVFGMKGDKDWILLADHGDPTLLRTAVALRISRLVSMPWTPKYRMAEVYFNGSYQGLYYLVEHKEADRDNKIPITPVAAGQTDGGYLLELDGKDDNDRYFRSGHFYKKIKYKDPDEPDAAQQKYIQDCFNQVEQKLQERAFTGDDSYRAYIELDSWIQNYIVHEVTMNIDGNMRLSTYFAKDKDTQLFMPMVWDFDRAFGGADYMQSEFNVPQTWPYGWFVRLRGGEPGYDNGYWYGYRATWYQYMFEDPVFVARLQERWALYKPRLDRIPEFIDKMLEYNALAYKHNQDQFRLKDQPSAAARLRSDYILRIAWLDQNIRALQPQRYNASTGQYQ